MITSENGLGRIASTGKDIRDAAYSLKHEGKKLLGSPKELSKNIVSALNYMYGFKTPVENAFRNEIKPIKAGMPKAQQNELKASNAVTSFVLSAFALLAVKKAIIGLEEKKTGYLERKRALRFLAEAMPHTDSKLGDELRIIRSMLNELMGKGKSEPKPNLDIGAPSLVLAYDLFEDISRESEVLSYG